MNTEMEVTDVTDGSPLRHGSEPTPIALSSIDHDVAKELKYKYDMSHASRGKAVIVNNVNFEPDSNLDERKGSEKDTQDLEDALQRLGFKTEIKKDTYRATLQAVFRDVSTEHHTDCDCFMFCIMTHGESDGTIHCVDGPLQLNHLMRDFKGDRCDTLAGKPKIFVIQACRGFHQDKGVQLGIANQGTEKVDFGHNTAAASLVTPIEADFLVAYSTPPDYLSWRDPDEGSWFIQALVKVLNEKGTSLEINQLLTRVNYEVANEYSSESDTPDFDNKKQMPYYTSTLTKELYFHEKKH